MKTMALSVGSKIPFEIKTGGMNCVLSCQGFIYEVRRKHGGIGLPRATFSVRFPSFKPCTVSAIVCK
jgi:hypothetical protein